MLEREEEGERSRGKVRERSEEGGGERDEHS